MKRESAKELADALYHLRNVLGSRPKEPDRTSLRYEEAAVATALRAEGHEPGKEALEADRLKLSLMGPGTSEDGGPP